MIKHAGSAEITKKTRIALKQCLGIDKLGPTDFGRIIGYNGTNIPATISNIETGRTGISGPVLARMKDLLQTASYHRMPIKIVPEWGWLENCSKDSDGSSIFIVRNWFPRMIFCATVQAAPPLEDLGFVLVGSVHNADPDIGAMNVFCLHQDLLPKPEWYLRFKREAIRIFEQELNAAK